MKSQLSFEVSLTYKEIAKSLNKYLAPLLYEGVEEQEGQASMSLRVVREGDIHVSQKDEVLVIEANVHVWVKTHRKRGLLDLWKDLPGISVEETDFNLQAKFYTTIQLNNQWELESQTVGNFTWTRKPKVGLGLLNLNISQIVAPTLQNQITIIADQIDEFILREIDLPTKAQTIWEEVCKPYKISEEWSSYFVLFTSNTQLNVQGPFWGDHKITLKITAPHSPSFYVQYKEPAFKLLEIKPFADKKPVSNLPVRYDIHLHLNDLISYLEKAMVEVSSLITIHLNSPSIHIEHEQYTFTSAVKFQIESKLFKTTFDANIRLSFQLEMGDEHQWIRFALSEYQLTVANPLLRWWKNFNHESLANQLEEKINTWLQSIQSDLISDGKDFLSGSEIHTNAYLKGIFTSNKLIATMQLDNTLVLILEADLRMYLKLHNF